MLRQLIISNYALIDHLEIDFKDGLSIITGETGAGKSIIIGALSLILGQKADARVVRDNTKKTVVEAVFDICNYNLKSFFEENDIEFDERECIIRRELNPSGRSRAFVNDTPVASAVLVALSQRLIDIHSQHSNALLLTGAYQLAVIDSLADNGALLTEYSGQYASLLEAEHRLEETRLRIDRNKADEEYYRFQLGQISSAGLTDGEQEELESRKNILDNLSLLRGNLSAACTLLNDGNSSAVGALSEAEHQIAALQGVYPNAGEISSRLDSALIEIKDIYETVSHDLDGIDGDPRELEAVEDRLNIIYSLQQRFRVESVKELLDIQAGLEKSLSEIENADDELHDLQMLVDKQKKEVGKLADKLTLSRKKAADAFAAELKSLVAYLGLKNFTSDISFEPVGFTKTGQDKICFKVSFNVNQKPLLIEQTASGGEISRLMLCIKAIIAKKMQLPSIIFDEIDTGISGEVANKIGELMRQMSANLQVLTITHLPQVAALGGSHYKVYKEDTPTETITRMKLLTEEERIGEIAGMLSGSSVDKAAIENAKSLMKIK